MAKSWEERCITSRMAEAKKIGTWDCCRTFCILCIGGSFGGGNAFQVVQSLDLIKAVVPPLIQCRGYGLGMVVLVGFVILGGIQSIAHRLIDYFRFMCTVYLCACIYILGYHFEQIPAAFVLIFENSFSFETGLGGFLGILIIGVKRAVFSNEAGIGSNHRSLCGQSYPSGGGRCCCFTGPFIDTIVVCTMTALVIIITGAYCDPSNAELIAQIRALLHPQPWQVLSLGFLTFFCCCLPLCISHDFMVLLRQPLLGLVI